MSLIEEEHYFRLLKTQYDEDLGTGDSPVSTGMAILLIFGIIYLFGFVYLLYSRFISDINEDIIYLAEAKAGEQMSLTAYCILNCLGVLIFCIISMFKSESDIGVSTVLGSDMYNICLVYGLIIFKLSKKNKKSLNYGRMLDAWLFLRDTALLLFGGGLIILFLKLEVNWWMGLIMFFYVFVFFFVISKNESIKNKIYRIIGITNEDDSFNAEELTKQKKRCVTLEVLVQNGFVDRQAEDLKKRIAKNEGLIIMKHENRDDPRAIRLMKFHAVVYTIMFAIRNKHKYEKEKRSQNYANLWKDQDEKLSDQDDIKSPNENDIKENNNDLNDESQLIQKTPKHQQQQPQGDDNNPIGGVEEQKSEQQQQNNKNLNKNNNNNGNSSQNEDDDDDDEEDNEEYESDDEAVEITMKLPKGCIGRLSYIIFFPFHLILFILPNYHKDPSLMKLFISFMLNLIFLTGTLFLIDWWSYEVAISLDFPIQIIGLVFISFGLTLPYLVYNLKVAKKEEENVEFMQSFLELAVFKISVCTGLPWMLSCLVHLDSSVSWVTIEGLAYVASSYLGTLFLIMIAVFFNSFKANKQFAITLFCMLAVFFISSVILILVKY